MPPIGSLKQVNLNVKMQNGEVVKRVIYVEQGIGFNLDGKQYSVRSDGMLWGDPSTASGNALNVTAEQYATLGGMSQMANEGGEENKEYYVLTKQDVEQAKKDLHYEDKERDLQTRVNNALGRLNVNDVGVLLSGDNYNSIRLKGDSFEVTLKEKDKTHSPYGRNFDYNKETNRISVFIYNEKK